MTNMLDISDRDETIQVQGRVARVTLRRHEGTHIYVDVPSIIVEGGAILGPLAGRFVDERAALIGARAHVEIYLQSAS